MRDYQDRVHVWGRIWMGFAFLIMVGVPLSISIILNVWPDVNAFVRGLFATATIFWAVTTIEVFTFAPMLGSAGTYLGFTTGNLTNLKVPSAMQAMEANNVTIGTEDGDVISTIAIASSSIITTLIILVGALLLIPITPLLESNALQPAFDHIIPALFGALGVVYIVKAWKIAIAPISVMLVIFLFVPGATGLVGVLVPVGVVISLITARILYKKGKL